MIAEALLDAVPTVFPATYKQHEEFGTKEPGHAVQSENTDTCVQKAAVINRPVQKRAPPPFPGTNPAKQSMGYSTFGEGENRKFEPPSAYGCILAVQSQPAEYEPKGDITYAHAPTTIGAKSTSDVRQSAHLSFFRALKNDFTSYLSIQLQFDWKEGDVQRTTESTICFDGRNIVGEISLKPITRDTLPSRNESLPIPELAMSQVFEEPEEECSEGSIGPYLMTIDVNGDILATNVMTKDSFGPHQKTIEQLRLFLSSSPSGALHIRIPRGGSGLLEDLESFNKVFRNEIQPLKYFWVNGAVDGFHTDSGSMLHVVSNPHECTRYSRKAALNFKSMFEFQTIGHIGLLRDHKWEKKSRLENERFKAHFLADPENDRRILFVLGPQPGIDKIREKDTFSVRIPALQLAQSVYWTGDIGPSFKLGHKYRVIYTSQSYDIGKKEFKGLSTSALGITKTMADLESETDKSSFLENDEELQNVDITVELTDKAYQRQHENYFKLSGLVDSEYERSPISFTEDLILANRFDRLPFVNMFAQVPIELLEKYRSVLSEQQQIAFDNMMAMAGGFAIISGSTGSGKTHTAAIVSKTLFHAHVDPNYSRGGNSCVSPECCSTDNHKRPGLNLLIATPSNGNADDLRARWETELAEIDPSVLAIRKYPESTRDDMFGIKNRTKGRKSLLVQRIDSNAVNESKSLLHDEQPGSANVRKDRKGHV